MPGFYVSAGCEKNNPISPVCRAAPDRMSRYRLNDHRIPAGDAHRPAGGD